MTDKPKKPKSKTAESKPGSKSDGSNIAGRSYRQADLKVLYGRSAGLCAFPGCMVVCIKVGVQVEDAVMIGQIAHIEGVKNDPSTRYNPDLSKEARDAYPNLMLLCNLHHPVVDEKTETGKPKLSVETLKKWKGDKEAFVTLRLQKTMPEVSQAELEIVTKHVLLKPSNPTTEFKLLSPEKKLELNELTDYVKGLLEIGLGKAREVEQFVEHVAAISPEFPESLKAGFVRKYELMWDDGFRGDGLFEGLRLYASQYSEDPRKEAAGLAVVTYFFEKCEVFKKE